jgi:hypothetical protein
MPREYKTKTPEQDAMGVLDHVHIGVEHMKNLEKFISVN